jgi:hypothetical protein
MPAAFSVIHSGLLTQFSKGKIAMMFFGRRYNRSDHRDGSVTTGELKCNHKSVMNQAESRGWRGRAI